MVGDILQPTHLLFVLVVALLVLGPKRLPEVGRTLGNGIRDFRDAINGESSTRHEELDSKPWQSEPEPEEKHEFAHEGETTPDSHEFAHGEPAPAGSGGTTESAPADPAVPAHSDAAPAQPAAPSEVAATPDKHEFAYETPKPADNPAGPRT